VRKKIRPAAQTLAGVAAGPLLVNTVPHAVAGLTGQRFPTPFAQPPGVGLSSPSINIAWGALNLVAGAALLRRVPCTAAGAAAVAGSGLAAAFGLSQYFGALNTNRGE